MLDWLFDLALNEGVLVGLVVAVFIGFERLGGMPAKRFWIWVASLVVICLVIWFKGAEVSWTWLLAAGWLGVLFYCDQKYLAPRP